MGGVKRIIFNKAIKTKLFNQTPRTCLFCSKTHSNYHSLQQHMASHTKEKPYQCGECDAVFGTTILLNAHQSAYHQKKRQYQCDKCHKFYYDRSTLNKHQSGFCDVIRGFGPRRWKDRKNTIQVPRKRPLVVTGEIKSRGRGRPRKTAATENADPSDPPYQPLSPKTKNPSPARTCVFQLEWNENPSHRVSQRPRNIPARFKDQSDFLSANSSKVLKRHVVRPGKMDIERGKRALKDPSKKSKFRSRGRPKRDKLLESETKDPITIRSDASLQTITEAIVTKKQNSHDDNAPSATPENSKILQNQENNPNLKTESQFSLVQDQGQSPSKPEERTKVEHVSGNNKIEENEIIDKNPVQMSANIKSAVRRVGYFSKCAVTVKGKVLYECPICQKLYTERSNLLRHHKTAHLLIKSEKPLYYPCSDCNETFLTYKLLWEHKKKGHDLKVYTCSFCPKNFVHSGNLWRHQRSAHKHQENPTRASEKQGTLPDSKYAQVIQEKKPENEKVTSTPAFTPRSKKPSCEHVATTPTWVSSKMMIPSNIKFEWPKNLQDRLHSEQMRIMERNVENGAFFLHLNRYDPSSC